MSKDEVLSVLGGAINECIKKTSSGNGRIKDSTVENVRIEFLKTAINGCEVYLGALKETSS